MFREESEILELKSSFGVWKEIIKSLCAFANKRGGTVIVGFNDNGEPLNLKIGKHTLEDFVNKLKANTDPILYPSVNVKSFALGQIAEIYIPPSDYKPVFAFGKAYTRVGKNTLQLSANEIRKLIKQYTLPDFDCQPVNIKFDHFEYDAKLIRKINDTFFDFKEENPARSVLSEFHLLNKEKLTTAGYLCFTEENKLFPAGKIKAARFKGDKPVHFIDMQEFTGNIINAVDDCMNFIKKHINMAVLIDGKPAHKEKWEYPLPALREAVINAVVHRDYNEKGNIQIRIFDNSLEIWSPGLLPKAIDINNIEETNRSIPRNLLIADVFHSLNYIEAWGTGLLRIIELSKQFGLKKPRFFHHQNAFIIQFNKKENVTNNVTNNVTDNVTGNVTDNRLLKLIELINADNQITTTELAEKTAVTKRTILRDIEKLKEQKKIIRIGSEKSGRWKVL